LKAVLKIEGMSCEHCVKHVKNALLAMPGVVSAEVSLAAGSASVECGQDIAEPAFREAIDEAGYDLVSAKFQA
jgi:Cu+-exporting ATPase